MTQIEALRLGGVELAVKAEGEAPATPDNQVIEQMLECYGAGQPWQASWFEGLQAGDIVSYMHLFRRSCTDEFAGVRLNNVLADLPAETARLITWAMAMRPLRYMFRNVRSLAVLGVMVPAPGMEIWDNWKLQFVAMHVETQGYRRPRVHFRGYKLDWDTETGDPIIGASTCVWNKDAMLTPGALAPSAVLRHAAKRRGHAISTDLAAKLLGTREWAKDFPVAGKMRLCIERADMVDTASSMAWALQAHTIAEDATKQLLLLGNRSGVSPMALKDDPALAGPDEVLVNQQLARLSQANSLRLEVGCFTLPDLLFTYSEQVPESIRARVRRMSSWLGYALSARDAKDGELLALRNDARTLRQAWDLTTLRDMSGGYPILPQVVDCRHVPTTSDFQFFGGGVHTCMGQDDLPQYLKWDQS